jgi:hypothetical protein
MIVATAVTDRRLLKLLVGTINSQKNVYKSGERR